MSTVARFALSVLLAATILIPQPSKAASFVDDVWGVVTDPLKLNKASSELSATVDRVLTELRELEPKANQDVKDRIEDLRKIVAMVIDATGKTTAQLNATVAEALARVNAIEDKTYQQAIDLIYRSQCLAEVLITDQIQRGISDSIANIIKANPGIKFLGIRVVSADLSKVDIVNPDQAYRSLKTYYNRQLSSLNPNDSAFQILSIYQNMARFARFARCHYMDLGLAARFLEEQKEYERLSSPWLNTVRPAL